MKCFYHKSDLDGHCSGAIIKYIYPVCEMIGVDYKDNLENYNIEKGELVYVVDFGFTPEEMELLNSKTKLVWIDHHKTKIEWAKESGFTANTGQSLVVGTSGCELTWLFELTYVPLPEAVRLLGRYDVWDHSDENILPFQYGLRLEDDTRPDNQVLWSSLFKDDYVEDIVSTGKTILRYENKQNKIFAEGMSFEADFHGYKAIVINKPYANSKVFDNVYNPNKHDIMILFGLKPGEFKYTLFSAKEDVDVGDIAKKYGGGGHKGAAGFYSKNLLFV